MRIIFKLYPFYLHIFNEIIRILCNYANSNPSISAKKKTTPTGNVT